MKYSLADYILSIKTKDTALYNAFNDISIGGEGSYLDNITISMMNNIYDTTTYATGGWVHNKNLSKAGTVSITLNQLSDRIAKFKQLINMYYSNDYDSLTLVLVDSNSNEVATCEDCFPQKIPDQQFADKANTQTWTFTCGKITFN